MGTIKTTNIETITGSGTLTLGQSGETISIPSGVTITNNGTQTGFGGVMTPAFFANPSSQQVITNQTDTKIIFNSEIIDTDNCYDNTTNYRFTPTTAGNYYIFITCSMETTGAVGTANYAFIKLKKNGTVIYQSYVDNSNNNIYAFQGVINAIVNMNGSTDYLEAYIDSNSTSGNMKVHAGTYSMFGGYKIIT